MCSFSALNLIHNSYCLIWYQTSGQKMPSHNYDPVPCPYVHLVGMLTEHILQHTLPNGKMIFTKTQLKCVRRQMTVHIHKLEMLIGERGKGGQNGWIHGKFSLCTDYIQNLLLPWDLPERAPPEKRREKRNLEIIICWRCERFIICHEPTILKEKLKLFGKETSMALYFYITILTRTLTRKPYFHAMNQLS